MAAVVRWITGKLLPTISTLIPSIVRLMTSGSASSSTTTESIQALEQLERRLRRIEAVLDDAEEREIQDKSVKLWLKEIKEVAYDAEDVVDEYQYELLRSRIEGRVAPESAETSSSSYSSSRKRKLEEREEQVYGSTSTSCSLLSPIIAKDLVDRINKINEKFDEIAKDRDALSLKELDAPRRKDDCQVPQPAGSHVDESGIYGREEDRDKIVDLLLSGDEKFTVLPIVGMGGLGKTTLAQIVYKDVRINQFFNLKGWVCVSDNFDVVRLTRAVIESFSKERCELTEFSALQDIIKEKLKGKRVILVLDDIWNEKQNLWDLLKAPLVEGEIIKIVITTRNDSVAELMQTMAPYRLGYLTKEKSWFLFQRHAFAGRDPNEEPILLEIGKQISQKCGGLPLAVKVVGDLLRHKEANEESWKDILQSNIWDLDGAKDEILPALRLSYYYLPAPLKPCFLYCSLFPKDYLFKYNRIIGLWVAQGYIIESSQKKSAEDLGRKYIEELKRRSLLQSKGKASFSIHDLVHDLASSISGKEYQQVTVVSDTDTHDIPSEVRHLHITSLLDTVPRQLLTCPAKTLRRLRTFVFDSSYSDAILNEQFPLENLSGLRALELHFDMVEGLPGSIGNLKHLRYFRIGSTVGQEVELPESVGQLYNLRVLDIGGYDYYKLTKYGFDDDAFMYGGGLDVWVPHGIGKLTNLMELHCFSVGRGGLRGGIEELKGLVGLTHLMITRLRNVACVEDAREADLQSKQRIEKLKLDWDGADDDGVSDAELETAVLESLRPACTNLRELEIWKYGGTKFPSWLGDPSFSCLFSVELCKMKNCEHLRALCQLPSLRSLTLIGIKGLKDVGRDLCCPLPTENAHFPSLESLSLSNLPEWEEWCAVVNSDFLPRLSSLIIQSCPKLRSLTLSRTLTERLQHLEIDDCHLLWLLVGLHRTTSLLDWLILRRCPELRIPPYELLPSIPEFVKIKDCPRLIEWCQAHGFTHEQGTGHSEWDNTTSESDDCSDESPAPLSSSPHSCGPSSPQSDDSSPSFVSSPTTTTM